MKTQENYENKQQIEQNEKKNKSAETIAVQPIGYEIGFAYFSPEISKKENIRSFNGNAIETLQEQFWTIKKLDDNKKLKWSRILKFMTKSLAVRFEYACNQNPNILKQISPIEFPNLKEINLFSECIENYEALTFLSAPYLEYLNIIYNNSPNFKAFNKMNLPSLRILCIYMRKDMQQNGEASYQFSIQDFDRWGFNLTQLRLEKAHNDAVMMQDLSRLAKSKSSLNRVYYFNSNRVAQPRIRSILEHKNITFQIDSQALNNFHLNQMFIDMDLMI